MIQAIRARAGLPVWSPELSRAPELAIVLLGGLGAALAGYLIATGEDRIAIAGTLLALLAATVFVQPRAAVVLTFLYLAVLGELRRGLIPVIGWSPRDILLLIAPAAAGLLVGRALLDKAIRPGALLGRGVLLLLLVMGLQIFNPRQGGLSVGLAGMLFSVAPLAWFWIGQAYATPAFLQRLFYRLVLPVAVAAALLGLYQTVIGFLPFEKEWIDISRRSGYAALSVRGTIRAVSFFPSSAEYASYLLTAVALLWAAFFQGRRRTLVLIAALSAAVFLIGSRGAVLFVLVPPVVLWAIQGRTRAVWLPRVALATAAGVVALVVGLSQIDDTDPRERGLTAQDPTQVLLLHQKEGLLDPFDAESSTGGIHLRLILDGFRSGFTNPLGNGLGSVTLAGARFGSSGQSSEWDMSNAFISLGLVGGALYLALVGLVLLTATRFWWTQRSLVALAIVGLLVVNIGQWLNGGHYAVAALIWFTIGALDRFQTQAEQ